MMRSMAVMVVVAAVGVASGCSSAQKKAEVAMVETASPTSAAAAAKAKAKPAADAKQGGERAGFDSETIYFDFDSSLLGGSATSQLGEVHGYLQDNPEATVTIEGHADERGTTEYNLALGERRAFSTKSYLERRGVEEARMRVLSYGEEKPAVQGAGEEAWSQNRRAELSAN